MAKLTDMSTPIAEIANGQIRGIKKRSIEGYEYIAFRGIPYAESPVGDLRFKVSNYELFYQIYV